MALTTFVHSPGVFVQINVDFMRQDIQDKFNTMSYKLDIIQVSEHFLNYLPSFSCLLKQGLAIATTKVIHKVKFLHRTTILANLIFSGLTSYAKFR